MGDSNLYNIKIGKGKDIQTPNGKYVRYDYAYFRFGDYMSRTYLSDPCSNPYNNYEFLRSEMDKSQSFLWIHPIGCHSNYLPIYASSKAKGVVQETIVPPRYAQMFYTKPTGIVTPEGTIVPQPLLPWKYFSQNQNGLYFDSSNENTVCYGGNQWTPVKCVKDNVTEYTTQQQNAIKKTKTWGENIDNHYIDNSNSLVECLDKDYIASRTYHCDLNGTYLERIVNHNKMFPNLSGNIKPNHGDDYSYSPCAGSFVFCYKFIYKNTASFGTDADSSNNNGIYVAPAIVLEVAATCYDENNNISSFSIPLTIVISESGELRAQCGNSYVEGTLADPRPMDVLPSQCSINNNKEEFDLLPIFVYPTFNGIVITSAAVRNLNSGGNDLFLKYPFAVDDVRLCAKIVGVNRSQYIMNELQSDPTNEMQFFPTFVQEAESLTSPQIWLSRTNYMFFGNTLYATWVRSVGRFAYVPLYFFRDLEFTVFFKGHPRGTGEDSGTYYFYPVATAQTSAEASSYESWSGMSSTGAYCVSSKYICTDTSTRTGYYRADFKFTCNIQPRYPIEVFGAAVVFRSSGDPIDLKKGNGSFYYNQNFQSQFSWLSEHFNDDENNYIHLMTNLDLSFTMDGCTGSMNLDSYAVNRDISSIIHDQSIGQISLTIYDKKGKEHRLFRGFGHSIQTNDGDGNYSVGVTLEGIQRKANDIKLVCAPFWDGDRLEMICGYMEGYSNIKIKMVDHTVNDIKDAKSVDYGSMTSSTGSWKASADTVANGSDSGNVDFRVPRSFDWQKPSVDFKTGTSIADALKQLGVFTSCQITFQPDGVAYFFELNSKGYPYYIDNQISSGNIVEFTKDEVVSITISPNINLKYNSFATMGFLQTKFRNPRNGMTFQLQNDLTPGLLYDKVDSIFPWSRIYTSVEKGFLTISQLRNLHRNKIKFGKSTQYSGTISVEGNTKVNHIYQCIKVSGKYFFVSSISHSINLGNKSWTTSYGVGYSSEFN